MEAVFRDRFAAGGQLHEVIETRGIAMIALVSLLEVSLSGTFGGGLQGAGSGDANGARQ